MSAAPLTPAEFARAMDGLGPFEPQPLLALAVSGGPDSMALAVLAAGWATARGGRAAAFIVDHGLRAEAAGEAAAAGRALAAIGVEARVLKIEAPPPASGLQAWARERRYALLEAAAAEIGALHLLLAHHRDDQAETVLMHRARGSGVKGLAGMRAAAYRGRVRLLRPLLAFPKSRLAALCHAQNAPVADDPSNRDRRFARVRARQRLAASGGAGALTAMAGRLAVDDAALEAAVADAVRKFASISPVGVVAIDRAGLAAAPPAIGLRLLSRAAHGVGGRAAPPRATRALASLDAVRSGEISARTLGRAVLKLEAGRVLLFREAAPAPAPASGPGLWDGRFLIRLEPGLPPGAAIRALVYPGLRQLEASAAPPAWIGAAPRRALVMLPAVWRGETLLAPPRLAGSPSGAGAGLKLFAMLAFRRPMAPC